MPARRKDGTPAAASPPELPRGVGFRPLATLVPRLTRPVFRRRSPAGAQIMADWPELVGHALAAVTEPERLSAGTLTIACCGPVAMELQHLAPELIERINAGLGRVAVERLRFRQRSLAGPAAPPRRRAPPGPPPAPVEGVADPALRTALERLAARVYRGRERARPEPERSARCTPPDAA
jgi:hypothetical protein